MTDLIAFLRARIDEDAAEIAKHPDDHGWPPDWQIVATEESNYPSMPFLQIAKKRAEREVETKQRVVELYAEHAEYDNAEESYEHATGRIAGLGEAVRLLAAVYSDHPDFDESWRP